VASKRLLQAFIASARGLNGPQWTSGYVSGYIQCSLQNDENAISILGESGCV